MDPLSVAASIAGLLTAAGELAKILGPYISAAKEVPPIASQVHSEVENTKTILSAVQNLTLKIGSTPIKNGSMILIEHIVVMLTDGVLIFSDLELTVGSLSMSQPSGLRLWSRLQWARKESTFTSLLLRLQGFKNSLSLMLTILQCDSDFRAVQHQTELAANIDTLLESNQALSRRLMNLEDVFDVQSIVSQRRSLKESTPRLLVNDEQQQSKQQNHGQVNSKDTRDAVVAGMNRLSILPEEPAVSSFEFETDLDASRVYRRAQRNSMDFSFRSSIALSKAWSALSDLSLDDISVISVIALPLYPSDLTNPHHYDFGDGFQNQRFASPPTLQTQGSRLETSIFHDCIIIKAQMLQVPGVLTWKVFDTTQHGSCKPLDPLNELRQACRRGWPLLFLIKQENWKQHWQGYMPRNNQPGQFAEEAIREFLVACTVCWGIDGFDLFASKDVTSGYNHEFLTVVKTLKMVMVRLTDSGIIQPVDLSSLLPKATQESRGPSEFEQITKEFLIEERVYALQLEELLDIKQQVELEDLLPVDERPRVFELLPKMLHYQIEFLLGLEVAALVSFTVQNWTNPFLIWEHYGGYYLAFIARLEETKRIIKSLLKKPKSSSRRYFVEKCLRLVSIPALRLSRYKKFLEDLTGAGQTELTNYQLELIGSGLTLIKSVLRGVDDAIHAEEHRQAIHKLETRMRDWKGVEISQQGELLLFSLLSIPLIRESGPWRIWIWSHVYFFQNALLFCAPEYPGLLGSKGPFLSLTNRSLMERYGTLSLSFRVFCKDITNVSRHTGKGATICELHVTESCSGSVDYSIPLKFRSEDLMNTWITMFQSVMKNAPLSHV